MKIVCESLNEFKKIDKPTYTDLGIGIYKGVKPEHIEAAKWLVSEILYKIIKDNDKSTPNDIWWYIPGNKKYTFNIDTKSKYLFYDFLVISSKLGKNGFKLDEQSIQDLISTLVSNVLGWKNLTPIVGGIDDPDWDVVTNK